MRKSYGLCKRLTPRERMVFDLKHFQGLKLRSVSEILNTSEGVGQDDFLPGHAEAAFPAQ